MIVNELMSIHEMWKIFEHGEEPDRNEFEATIGRCITSMLQYGSDAVKPRFFMSNGEKTDSNYIFYFCAEDLNKPREEKYNLHGNNTSQVSYNGAIVVDRKIKKNFEVYGGCHTKIIPGHICQLYDPDSGKFISQEFTPGEKIEWKNDKGELIKDPANDFLCINLIQPTNEVRVHT